MFCGLTGALHRDHCKVIFISPRQPSSPGLLHPCDLPDKSTVFFIDKPPTCQTEVQMLHVNIVVFFKVLCCFEVLFFVFFTSHHRCCHPSHCHFVLQVLEDLPHSMSPSPTPPLLWHPVALLFFSGPFLKEN